MVQFAQWEGHNWKKEGLRAKQRETRVTTHNKGCGGRTQQWKTTLLPHVSSRTVPGYISSLRNRKHTLPNFSFVERLKNSKPILFLQMFKLSYSHCHSYVGLSRIKVIPTGHDTGYPAIDYLDFIVDKAKGKEVT